MEEQASRVMTARGLPVEGKTSAELWFALAFGTLLSVVFAAIVSASGGSPWGIAAVPLLAVILLMCSSFEFSLAVLILSLFVDVHVSLYSAAVCAAFPFAASFLLKYQELSWREFRSSLSIPLLVYGIAVVPSFWNLTRPLPSLMMLGNIVAFLIVLFALTAAVRTYRGMAVIAGVFIAGALINSLYLFWDSFTTGRRSFGFAGIMFVDYAALAVCLTFALSLVARGSRRAGYAFLSVVFAAALVQTQTRNTWISAAVTLLFVLGYVLARPEIAGITRKRAMALSLLGLAVLAGAAGVAAILSPGIEQRTAQLTGVPRLAIDATGGVSNSLVSRLLIWETALQAFLQHPFIGIGLYAFPFSSQEYYRIPKFLYRIWVEGLTPHQTFIAVLTETGIVGALGFIGFISASLRSAFRGIREAPDQRGSKYAFVAAVAVVYSFVSMLFTDAWLWGQCLILLALILGVVSANRTMNRIRAVGEHIA